VFDGARNLCISVSRQVDKSKLFVDQEEIQACVRPGVLEVRARPLTFNMELSDWICRRLIVQEKRFAYGIDRPMGLSNALLINSVLVIFMTGKHVVAANEHRNMEKSRKLPRGFFWMTVVSHKASRAKITALQRLQEAAVTMRTSDFRMAIGSDSQACPQHGQTSCHPVDVDTGDFKSRLDIGNIHDNLFQVLIGCGRSILFAKLLRNGWSFAK